MSFETVYLQLCNFQETVIGATGTGNRTLKAPKIYPSQLLQATLPCFINTFGRYRRLHLGTGVYEYRGVLVMTLYTSIAGVREDGVNQFDSVAWIDRTVANLERYPLLQVNGVGDASLVEPLQITDVEPHVPNLRYPGNGDLLFWGGRVTCTLAIDVPKDC